MVLVVQYSMVIWAVDSSREYKITGNYWKSRIGVVHYSGKLSKIGHHFKGQIIFWPRILPKNERKHVTYVLVKTNSFVHFLEEIDDLQNHFEINWPLEYFLLPIILSLSVEWIRWTNIHILHQQRFGWAGSEIKVNFYWFSVLFNKAM